MRADDSGINLDAVFKMAILVGFAAFFGTAVFTGSVTYYVHPRIVPYVIFGACVMILIGISLVGDVFHSHKAGIHIVTYGIFLIPLIMAFSIPPTTITSASGRKADVVQNAPQSGPEDASDIPADDPASRLKIEEGTIIFDDSNFAYSMDEIYRQTDTYIGKKVNITGFVLREPSFRANEFVIARFMMVCCAADAQAVGIMCHYDDISDFKSDTWVNLTGRLGKTEYLGRTIPAITVEMLTPVDKPANEYIYLY